MTTQPPPHTHQCDLKKPATCREESETPHLLLQRGGYWSAVTAVKKWCKHRRQLVYAQRKACERTDEALTKLDAAARRHTDTDLHGLVTALSDAVLLYRGQHRRRVELTESSGNVSTELWTSPPAEALRCLTERQPTHNDQQH